MAQRAVVTRTHLKRRRELMSTVEQPNPDQPPVEPEIPLEEPAPDQDDENGEDEETESDEP